MSAGVHFCHHHLLAIIVAFVLPPSCSRRVLGMILHTRRMMKKRNSSHSQTAFFLTRLIKVRFSAKNHPRSTSWNREWVGARSLARSIHRTQKWCLFYALVLTIKCKSRSPYHFRTFSSFFCLLSLSFWLRKMLRLMHVLLPEILSLLLQWPPDAIDLKKSRPKGTCLGGQWAAGDT